MALTVAAVLSAVAFAPPAHATSPTAKQTYAWGQGAFGTIGNGTTPMAQPTPVAVSLPSGVTASNLSQSGGADAEYAIGSNGKLYAWGGDEAGQLGNGTGGNSATLSCMNGPNPFPCATTPVIVRLPTGVTAKAVAAATLTGYAIGSNGTLYAWGEASSGELGDGTYGAQTCSQSGASYQCTDTPVVVKLPTGVKPISIAAGSNAAYAVGSDGNLYAWGGNAQGQLGNGTFTGTNTPVKVPLPAGVTPATISTALFDAYLTTKTGQVYSWGYGSTGQLGTGDQGSTACLGNSAACTPTPTPINLPAGTKVSAIAGGAYSTYAIAGAKLYVWGTAEDGSLGGGATTTNCNNAPCNPLPQVLTFPGSGSPTTMAPYGFGAFVASSDGNLYTWGYNVNGASGNGSSSGESIGARVSLPVGFGPGRLGSGYVTGYTVLAAA